MFPFGIHIGPKRPDLPGTFLVFNTVPAKFCGKPKCPNFSPIAIIIKPEGGEREKSQGIPFSTPPQQDGCPRHPSC